MSKATEIWKPVKGFEGLYEVSNLGQVRSLDREVVQTVKIAGKILAPNYKERGGKKAGAAVSLRKDGETHCLSVPRLVLETFVGPAPERTTRIKRKIRDTTNNSLENLSW